MAAVQNKDRLCHLCHQSGSVRSLWLFCLAPSAAAGVILADGPACNCKSSSQRPEGSPVGRAQFKLKGFKSLCTCQRFQSWPGLLLPGLVWCFPRLQPFPCSLAGLGLGAGCCCSFHVTSVLVSKNYRGETGLRHHLNLPLLPAGGGTGLPVELVTSLQPSLGGRQQPPGPARCVEGCAGAVLAGG